jgi:ABC-type cobalamin/Fe3+-siderophores transport system ATPase subunit
MGIKIKNVHFSYGLNPVLQDINLNFEKGKIYGLLGLNGSGKTTLLKVILGLIQEAEGEVLIQGKNKNLYNATSLSKNIAYVPQHISITYDLSVMDFLLMGFNPYLKLLERPGKKHENLARTYLEEMKIEMLEDKNLSTLSGGELQMVLIARALIQDTDFIIMDEPVSSLDLKNQRYVMEKIKEISSRYNKGIIVSLHDPNLIRRYCDRAILLKNGSVVESGSVLETINRANLKEIYDMPFEKFESPKGTNYLSM